MFCLDTMENWDEKKLEEVVNKKHGEAEKKKAKTQIVSLFWWLKNEHLIKTVKSNVQFITDNEQLLLKKL